MAGLSPARAVLRLDWPGEPVVITWPQPAGDALRRSRCCPSVVVGEVLIASTDRAGLSLLEIADVICCPAGQALTAAVTPDQVLGRYPGSAVAAAPCGGHRCQVATRAGHHFTVKVAGLGVTGAGIAVLGACFAYCWLAAGGPLRVLESAELTAGAGESSTRWPEIGDKALPVPFGISSWI